jgi:two-component system sensor histidine kinase RpfC
MLRIVIVGIVLAYISLVRGPADGWPTGLAVFFAIAVGIFLAICVWPSPNNWRRVVSMILDVSAVTFYLWFAGAIGVMMFGVFLFITFGNGFRYGRFYLFVCQALCVAGFSAALLFVPYWQQHLVEGFSLLEILIVIPLYVSTLLKRVQEARTRAEQALKECLERDRSHVA